MKTIERVQMVIRDVLEIEEYEVYPEALLQNDLKIDERTGYEIFSKLKSMYNSNIQINRNEVLQLKTVKDVADFIDRKINNLK